MGDERTEVGFVRYDGKAVGPGILDAGMAGIALTGLDDLLRYFNSKQSSELAKAEYEVPVRIREGSWEAAVLAGVAVVGAFGIAYAKRAGEEMAKRDFDGVGLKDIFKRSLTAIVDLIRLAKHTGKLKGWSLENVRWRNDNTEVGIPNAHGEYEYLPVEFVEWYAAVPAATLAKLAQVVEEERTLTVSVRDGDILIEQRVTIREKRIFTETTEEVDEELLFPELEHGMQVRLEGRLIRGNAETNSIGLEYQGHNLNCIPEQGSIVQYKSALFLRCIVEGGVTRHSKSRFVVDRRPTIIIRRVTPLESDSQGTLL
ncbi:MAG: hypothetical protein BroJett031_32020 [Betaproteobacteria bacterium]|nr:MAG: hypothetical protein BroJett031_32020 [Betaproteobacteria bacterium]